MMLIPTALTQGHAIAAATALEDRRKRVFG